MEAVNLNPAHASAPRQVLDATQQKMEWGLALHLLQRMQEEAFVLWHSGPQSRVLRRIIVRVCRASEQAPHS